ncbi:Hypothetical predicted protein [Cloeon dipterum]|uniref:Uncharacterized protein n=1 Tax=Cloeon dipterum TaxID=197152 RepID=A0A8S1CG75_9INSE|nr:Hypothetical predicted protein [Cloeon dipterum]
MHFCNLLFPTYFPRILLIMPRTSPSDFTEEELKKLTNAIIKRNAFRRIRQLQLYKDLVTDFVLNGRSASSMMLAMKEQISPCFEKYCTVAEAKKFREHYFRNECNSEIKNDKNRFKDVLTDSESSTDMEGNLSPLTRKKKRTLKMRPSQAKSQNISQASIRTELQDYGDSDEDVQFCEEIAAAPKKNSPAKQNLTWSPSTNFKPGTAYGVKRKIVGAEKNSSKLRKGNSTDAARLPSFSAITNFSTGATLRGRGKQDEVGDDLLASIGDEHQPRSASPSFSDLTCFSTGSAMRGRSKPDDNGNELLKSVEDHPRLARPQKNPSSGGQPASTPTKVAVVVLRDYRKPGAQKSQGVREVPTKTKPTEGSHPTEDAARENEEIDFESVVEPCITDLIRGTRSLKEVVGANNERSKKNNLGMQNAGNYLSQEKDVFMSSLKLYHRREKDTAEAQTEDEFEADQNEQMKQSVEEQADGEPELSAVADRPAGCATSSKSLQKGMQKPGNPMIAVGIDYKGRKCLFKLVPMTPEEIDAIQDPCLPYQLLPPSLTVPTQPMNASS